MFAEGICQLVHQWGYCLNACVVFCNCCNTLTCENPQKEFNCMYLYYVTHFFVIIFSVLFLIHVYNWVCTEGIRKMWVVFLEVPFYIIDMRMVRLHHYQRLCWFSFGSPTFANCWYIYWNLMSLRITWKPEQCWIIFIFYIALHNHF